MNTVYALDYAEPWIAAIEQQVFPVLRADPRLKDADKLIARFSGNVTRWRAGGEFRPIVEDANELAAAVELLRLDASDVVIRYEPKLMNTAKSIDFSLEWPDGTRSWLDVKTVAPQWIDDAASWQRFENLEAAFPNNARLIVSRNWAGAAISGLEIKAVATGAAPATFTQVMSGQIDIGWSAPPYVVEESRAGKVRVIARESDLEAFRNQTVRMNFTNMTVLTAKADQLKRFIAAYEETLDWMYADPAGIKTYAEFAGITEDQAKYIRDTYFPKNNLIPRRLSGLDNAMADALAMKFINAPLTKDQLDEFLKYYVK